MALKDRREKLRKREERVDELVKKNVKDVKVLARELKEEREERDELAKRRKDLREELEKEIKADDRGKGDHPEHWEEWANTRRDELADLFEASEARSDRLVKRVIGEKKRLDDLKKRDAGLEKRISRLTKQIAEIQADRAGRLSRDFHIREFDCRDGTRVPTYMEDDLRALCRGHLQPLRDSGGSVTINSGFRTASYNAQIGGATASYHIYTLRQRSPAADHVQSGRSASVVQRWHDTHNPPDGMGYYYGFTHIDDRGYRSRWYGAS